MVFCCTASLDCHCERQQLGASDASGGGGIFLEEVGCAQGGLDLGVNVRQSGDIGSEPGHEERNRHQCCGGNDTFAQ